MKKLLLVFVALSLVFSACVAKKETLVAQLRMETVVSSDAWKEFDKAPLKMDAERAEILGLREVALIEPLRTFNCMDRKNNLWKEEVLPDGTKVLVNEDGIPLYKRSCFNKFFVPVSIQPVAGAVVQVLKHSGFWAGFWNVFWDILKWIGIILGTLLFLLLLLCLLRLFRWPWRVARRLFGGNNSTPLATPVVTPTPRLQRTPASMPIPIPVITLAPTSVKTWTIKGSFDKNGKIIIEGEGFKTFSAKCLSKEVSIKAFRR